MNHIHKQSLSTASKAWRALDSQFNKVQLAYKLKSSHFELERKCLDDLKSSFLASSKYREFLDEDGQTSERWKQIEAYSPNSVFEERKKEIEKFRKLVSTEQAPLSKHNDC